MAWGIYLPVAAYERNAEADVSVLRGLNMRPELPEESAQAAGYWRLAGMCPPGTARAGPQREREPVE